MIHAPNSDGTVAASAARKLDAHPFVSATLTSCGPERFNLELDRQSLMIIADAVEAAAK